MRTPAALCLSLVLASCTATQPAESSVSSAVRSTGPGRTGAPQPLTGPYGLLMAGDHLEMIDVNGAIAASVPVKPPSLVPQGCAQGAGVWTLPPVSSSDSHVYFRDGDTRVRVLVPPSSSDEVTTVPGGANTISGFSVSPDDQRIAVSVETLSDAGISDRLYVEDLRGGGHHADIYSTSTPAGKQTVMLWPMGWHQGRLVLAVWLACTFESLIYPSAWHVADATTADRLASIGDQTCIPGAFPSPFGIACFDYSTPGHVRVFDWSGAARAKLTTDTAATELSPSGDLLAFGNGGELGNMSPSTVMLHLDGSGIVNSPGHIGCLWIDDAHLLAWDAVIGYPSGTATKLPQEGRCAGRFPGGL